MKLGVLMATLVLATGAQAQHAQHASHGSAARESGQAQFAAVAEIVDTLRADTTTDWTAVDLDALHAHLLDMDNVTMAARASRTTTGMLSTFSITGDPVVAQSIQRMVMAHAPMLAQETGWAVEAAPTAEGATLSVTVADKADLDQVVGLGFLGLMTIGAHHRQHHEMIARGMLSH